MAKKSSSGKSDRTDPRLNKSLAIRRVLKTMPNATAAEIVAAVKEQYGHQVHTNMVYMIKTKGNMASDGRPRRLKSEGRGDPMASAALWVAAIKIARELLKVTGSVANATALLKALDK